MELTITAIAEYLNNDLLELRASTETTTALTGLRVLTGRESALNRSTLYVSTYEAYNKLSCAPASDTVFLVSDFPAECLPDCAIVIKPDCDLSDVSNRLLDLFDATERYKSEIVAALIAGKGYSPFFDIAARMFPHCLIVMTDSAYNIIQKNKDSVDDSYLNAIIQRGFYNKSDIDSIAQRGYFEDELKYTRPVLYDPSFTVSGRYYMVRSYRKAGATLSFTGCYYLGRNKPSELDYILYKCFTDYLYLFMENYVQPETEWPKHRQRLISDLINIENADDSFYVDRCLQLGIPYSADYRIGLIRTNTDTVIKAAQIANQLKAFCTVRNYGVFQIGTYVFILFADWRSYSVKESIVFEESWKSLLRSVEASNSKMGISLGFSSAKEMHNAHIQAYRALMVAENEEQYRPVTFYAESYLSDIISEYKGVLPLDAVYVKALDELNSDNNA